MRQLALKTLPGVHSRDELNADLAPGLQWICHSGHELINPSRPSTNVRLCGGSFSDYPQVFPRLMWISTNTDVVHRIATASASTVDRCHTIRRGSAGSAWTGFWLQIQYSPLPVDQMPGASHPCHASLCAGSPRISFRIFTIVREKNARSNPRADVRHFR